ncbi:MAG: hypothetical protein ACO1NQ_05565 [Flavobacteriales bacterium]
MRTIRSSDIQLLLELFAERSHHALLIDLRGVVERDVPWPMRPLTPGAQRVVVRTDHHWAAHAGTDLIIDIGAAPAMDGYQRTVLHAMGQADGHVRWLYTPGRSRSVLRFHSAAGRRGRLVHRAIGLASALGLEPLLRSHVFTIHHRRPLRLDRSIAELPHEHRAIFLGTPGAQRKFSVVLETAGKVTAFVKIARDERTAELLRNERRALETLSGRSDERMVVPTVYATNDERVLACSNVASEGMFRSTAFTDAHTEAMLAIIGTSTTTNAERTEELLDQLRARVGRVIGVTGSRGRLLTHLNNAIAAERQAGPMTMATAHGDLTPWNIHCASDRLAIYDWEMHRPLAPALFDLVHFHLQQGIVVDRLPFMAIRARIERACALPAMAAYIEQHALDMDRCIRWYLIDAVSYFLEVYAAQPVWSATQQVQLFAWEQAMAHMFSDAKAPADQRRELLHDISDMLHGAPHAFLKFRWSELAALPVASDLDLAIDRATAGKVLQLCSIHPLVQRHRVHRRSFMTVIELYLRDGSYLAMDLIHRFQRKAVTMLPMDGLLVDRRTNENGVTVPAFEHDVLYLFLFHMLNGARIPEKYRQCWQKRPHEEWQLALQHVKRSTGLSFEDRATFWDADPAVCRPVLMRTLRKRMSAGEWVWRMIQYAGDTVRELVSGRGFVVTFSGVDGAGKSTVVGHVKDELERTFRRKVVLMRHRPGSLPMLNAWRVGRDKAEHIASTARPRQGRNTSVFGSSLRFAYYYIDYLIGQWYVHFRHVMRGRIVLYDRYYFDFMADPRRSNLELDPRPLRLLYRFIHKPRLNFFLYADSATILQRKRELEREEVELLTDRYLRLFRQLGSSGVRGRYITLRNDDLEDTLNGIRAEYIRVA